MFRKKKKMRIDFKEFTKQKKAGVVVILIFSIALALSFLALNSVKQVGLAYLEASGHQIPSYEVFKKLIAESEKPVAVMFRSESCPVCSAMYPYWARLEESSENLPVDFYDILYQTTTAKAFYDYNVDETPTFIVFIRGKPVARHVGGFESKNITRTMLIWAQTAGSQSLLSTQALVEQGLRVFNKKCSACHGALKPSREEASKWLESRVAKKDPLALKMREAIESGKYLQDLYGGWGGLRNAITEMRKYVSVSAYEADQLSYTLSYMTSIIAGKKPPKPMLSNETIEKILSGRGEATKLEPQKTGRDNIVLAVGVLASFSAGIIAAFSPCTFPLLLATVTAMSKSGRRAGMKECLSCGAASIGGVFALGFLFILASPFVGVLQSTLLPVVAGLVVVAGVSSLLGVPVELAGLFRGGRGLTGFCAVYGFLAVQCNLPLVAGALLLALSMGDILSSLVTLAGFSIGIAAPVSLTLYARGPLKSLVEKTAAKTTLLEQIGGAVMIAAGVFLLAYSLGLIAL